MTYPRVVVDLGSNTFHWVIASGAAVETFERRGLSVSLAAGLSKDGELAPEALSRAEVALAQIGNALRDIPWLSGGCSGRRPSAACAIRRPCKRGWPRI